MTPKERKERKERTERQGGRHDYTPEGKLRDRSGGNANLSSSSAL
jgi:hypothetical protein